MEKELILQMKTKKSPINQVLLKVVGRVTQSNNNHNEIPT